MYSELNKHCRECICPSCDLFQTEECIEGENYCEQCANDCHVGHCWWHSDEREDGHV